MNGETTIEGGPPVVRPDDENLDAASATFVERELAALAHLPLIVLDLSAVRFADSIGLGLLTRLARRWPGKVVMANVGPPLRRCLDRVPGVPLPPVAPATARGPSAPPASPPGRTALAASAPAPGEPLLRTPTL